MNFRLLSRLLGIISLLIGGMMVFSLIWAWPGLGHRRLDGVELIAPAQLAFESAGFWGLVLSVLASGLVGGVLIYFGRHSRGHLYRKEAMAVVGLSWILATVLGAMPFWFSGVYRNCAVRLSGPDERPLVYEYKRFWLAQHWKLKDTLPDQQYRVVEVLATAQARGLSKDDLLAHEDLQGIDVLASLEELREDEDWQRVIYYPGEGKAAQDRQQHYRLRWIRMGICRRLV